MSGPQLVPVDKPLVRVRLFGALEARSYTDENVLPRGKKARAILAYLLLCGDADVPRRRLAALLWSTRYPEQAQTSARQAVLELRRAFARAVPDVLTIDRDTIHLDRRSIWVDGLSRHAEGEASVASYPADSFLEMLEGLDVAFDKWIAAVRDALRGRDRVQPARPPVHGLVRAPRVDVVPFEAFGADDRNMHLAPALAHELATGLSRFRWIAVRLARERLPGEADYRLEGHMAHGPGGGRLTVRLVDQQRADAIAWVYADDIALPLQPQTVADIAEKIVARLDPEILAIETRKIGQVQVVSGQSYDLLLRAIPALYTFTRQGFDEAMGLLGRALSLNPTFGRAQAFSALCRVTGLAQGWLNVTPEEVARIDALTAQAIANDPEDSLGLGLAAHVRVFIHKDFEGAKALFARAIEVNPNCGFSWGYSAITYAYLRQTREARERLARARRVMVHEPFGSLFGSFEVVILYFERNWTGAVETARATLARLPGFTNIRKLLVAALAMQGDDALARAEHRIILATEPHFDWDRHIRAYPFSVEADRVALRRAIEHAGLLAPEPRKSLKT